MNILVVDNKKTNVDDLISELEKYYNVFYTPSFDEVNNYLRNNNIDLIISDLIMPSNEKYQDPNINPDGSLTGWICLKKDVFPKYKNLKNNTIILTRYIKVFEDKVPNKKRNNIFLVDRDKSSYIDDIKNHIKSIKGANKDGKK